VTIPPAARITAGELVLVCSRYDLGAIQSVRRIKGGSRESPKILVVSDRGRFLIKRRAPASSAAGGELVARVALSHQVQLHLAARGFPVAPLVGTRSDNNSLLELRGFIYEVFRFVDGRRYDRTPAAAHAAGHLLASLHHHLGDFRPRWSPPEVTYHAHAAVVPGIDDLIARAADPTLTEHLRRLRDAYINASAEASRLGVDRLPTQLIHADWHPGNLLFAPAGGPATGAAEHIVAVLDFDSVRLGPVVVDLANGALQFAVARRATAAGTDPDDRGRAGIRVRLNPELFQAFIAGYLADSAGRGATRIQRADLSVLPWLMVEAMIVETIAPIAATGQFGKVSAAAALAMTRHAAAWISEQAPYLVSVASGR
jgi:Ser/Thr protein kinase RdoA (MazF antagonist)